jgi:prephenate dehydratase
MRIAIQGELGSFHHAVAQQWFGHTVSIVPAETFPAVFESVKNNTADAAIVAIENSIYGSINQVYDLLESYHYPIVGEVHLRVSQQLIAIDDHTKITHIYSHPVALAQCEAYLDATYPLAKRIEYHDTAAAVGHIKTLDNPHYAAIAGAQAAILYDLPIIATNIEDNPENYTRFLVLDPNGVVPAGANRSSIVITTDHTPGALAKILTVIAGAGVNVSKLQSRPIIGSPWQYRFYLVLDTAGRQLHSVVQQLQSLTESLVILGEYCRAR